MRRERLAILAVILALFLAPCAGAISMTLNTSENKVHVGDMVRLSGSMTGVKTIAVYLFLIGPGLSHEGVTLENLNVPIGRGLYTTAPVDLVTGQWTYDWDTSVILGNLKPGKYKVYATYGMSTSVDQLMGPNSDYDYATTEIEFLPSETPANEVPVPITLPLTALLFAAGIVTIKRLG